MRSLFLTAVALTVVAVTNPVSAQVREPAQDGQRERRVERTQEMVHETQRLTERSREMNQELREQVREQQNERVREQFRLLERMGESLEQTCHHLTESAERLQIMQQDRDMVRNQEMQRDMERIRDQIGAMSEQARETLRIMEQVRARVTTTTNAER